MVVGTLPESGPQLDWEAWRRQPSSMVVPTRTTGICFVRSVLAIGFAGLCLILKDFNSAQEIEDAWLQMPKVKARKANRGTSAGWMYKRGLSWGGGQSSGYWRP